MLNYGYTLTSLLISMSIGVSLLGAGATFAMNLSQKQLIVSQQLELQNHIKRVGLLISAELRRAGYDGKAEHRFISGLPRTSSPFYPAFSLGMSTGHLEGSCILFHYDKNHNGQLDELPRSEFLGFRLNNGAIESRVGAKDCSQTGWEDVTDSTYLRVNKFHIKGIQSSGVGALLSLEISAELTRAPDVNSQIHWPVVVRNN
ncbi:hypothetical protein [Salinimonas iocasae]|uniref:Prepilin peptidase dependent protein B n=1 Tax=Salinimonas iocasae TaxID=2572577 RepID=A0A5B7YBY5_9ALTE|nr:hypothetical protein [Salinimonas iocasae]QCZ93015.1 hypothetical protein FBQ74_05715 [Salinimonas iocasae]